MQGLYRHVINISFKFFFLVIALFFRVEGNANPNPFSWNQEDLFRDLMVVREIDCRLADRFPVTYNFFLEGGYLAMPSARMGDDGSVSFGYASLPPYYLYSARLQLFERLEIVGNYRIFRGVDDAILTPHGFGDFSDKGANVKLVLMTPEESDYELPGLAVGMQDFLGTKNFDAQYLVATQVWRDYDLECSFGYGFGRLEGVFGGVIWKPWRNSCQSYLEGISFVAELDSTNYKDPNQEPHPEGRTQKSCVNCGMKYRLWKYLDFSIAYMRGNAFAWSASGSYPLGTTEGLLCKSQEAVPYCSPVNTQPIGLMRPAESMMHSFLYALKEQGLDVLEGWISTNEAREKVLRLKIMNTIYRYEYDVRSRLNHVLKALTPSDVAEVIVTIDNSGLSVHEYHYRQDHLQKFCEQAIGEYELTALTPLKNPTCPDEQRDRLLFHQSRSWLDWELNPRSRTFFGSSKGKFKYSIGVSLDLEGYLCKGIYYDIGLSKTMINQLSDVEDRDMLNPSTIVNVRTDMIRYQQNSDVIFDRMFLQKSWYQCKHTYMRAALGHFEEMYAGVAFECLYHPIHTDWAIGWESAMLWKRNYTGIGVTNQIRWLDLKWKSHFKTFHPHQHFLEFYYDWKEAMLEFHITAGQFLARDLGARFEITRFFPSGLSVSLWYTYTNARDIVNRERYHDHGVAVSLPLDIFYEKSSRDRWNYGLSAWLRDVGARAATGRRLYGTIQSERRSR